MRLSIRTKLLLMLLALTLPPLLLTSWRNQQVLAYLGAGLTSRTTTALSEAARRLLAQITRDYATLLKREREIVELILLAQTREQTGGDYYDFIRSPGAPDSPVLLAIGDVSGHGVSSALMMASVRALLRQHVDNDAEKLCGHIVSAVDDFRAGLAQADDLSLIILKVT